MAATLLLRTPSVHESQILPVITLGMLSNAALGNHVHVPMQVTNITAPAQSRLVQQFQDICQQCSRSTSSNNQGTNYESQDIRCVLHASEQMPQKLL
jgi:hypothetical protein